MVDPQNAVPGSASLRRARCRECKTLFRPHPRLKARQKTCGVKVCVLRHRARYRRGYRLGNPEPEKEYRDKASSSRGAGFWKSYRKANSRSTDRNRSNANLRSKLETAGLQRQLDIAQVFDPPGLFDSFREFATSHRSLIESCHATGAA